MKVLSVCLATRARISALRRWLTKHRCEPSHVRHTPIANQCHTDTTHQFNDHKVNSILNLNKQKNNAFCEPGDAAQHSRAADLPQGIPTNCTSAGPKELIHLDEQCVYHPHTLYGTHTKSPLAEELPVAGEDVDQQQQSPLADPAVSLQDLGLELCMPGLVRTSYTDTPARIVSGFDGVKECPVILLTFDLSTKMQEMIRFQRVFIAEEREAQAKLEVISEFQAELSEEILNHQNHIEMLKQAGGDATEELEGELETLELLAKSIEVRSQIIEDNLKMRAGLLREYQADVDEYLEEAFVSAEAIEPAAEANLSPVPKLDLQEEYQKIKQQHEDVGEGGPQETNKPIETGDEFMRKKTPLPTPAAQARTEASRVLAQAEIDLQHARLQFDQKNTTRGEEYAALLEADARGLHGTDASLEDFDLRWVDRNRQITRDLIEAEEALSYARVGARDAGLGLEHAQQSWCFPEDNDDGSPDYASADVDSPETVDSDPRMVAWWESLTDAAGPQELPNAEVDDWLIEEEPDWDDSISAICEDLSKRKHIATWEQMRADAREEMSRAKYLNAKYDFQSRKM